MLDFTPIGCDWLQLLGVIVTYCYNYTKGKSLASFYTSNGQDECHMLLSDSNRAMLENDNTHK